MVKFIVTNGTYSIVSSNSSVPLFVGYGTSNPQYTLDIQGDVSISNSIYNNGTPFSGGGGGSGIVYWTLNSLNSNIYYLLGNVGIGSTIPRKPLDLNKISISNTTIAIAREVDSIQNVSIESTNTAIQMRNGTQSMIECGSNTISLITNNLERFRVHQNGWIGIGTKTPLQKLHIEGSYMSPTMGITTSIPSSSLHLYSSSLSNDYYRTTGILLENSTTSEVGLSFYNSNNRLTGSIWAIGLNQTSTRLDINYGLQTNQFQDNDIKLALYNSGGIGIGTTSVGGFSFSVNGGLYTSSNALFNSYIVAGALDVQGVHITATSPVPYNTLNTTTGTNFLNYMSKTVSLQKDSWWIGSTTLAYTSNTAVSMTPGNGLYSGATLLKDGRVLFIPYYSPSFDIYNPYTNVLTRNSSIIGTPSASYSGGVLLPDGRIVCVPHYSGNVGIYNPTNNTLATVGTFLPAGSYNGGVLAPDGRVILVPHNNDYIGVYNSSTNAYSTIAISSTGFYKFAGGVLTATGKIIFVPYDADHIGIFDPSTNGYSTVSTGQGATNNLYFGGVLLPSGVVLFVPNNSTYYGFFNPITNVFSTRTGAGPQGSFAYRGGVLTSDNRVIMIPYGTTSVAIYDISTGTFSTYNYGGTANSAGSTFIGGVLTTEGTIVLAPFFGGEIGVLSQFPRTPLEFCSHPCYNKL